MAKHATRLIQRHNLSSVIKVYQGRIEQVKLPQPVDIIVSEWMGHFLLKESMFESVIFARDKWLQPGGVMLPSGGTMSLSGFSDASVTETFYSTIHDQVKGWTRFVKKTKATYG